MLNPEVLVRGALNLILMTGEGALLPRLSSYCHVPLKTGEDTSFGIFQMRVREILSNSQEPPGGVLFADDELDFDEIAAERRLSFVWIEPFTAVALEPRCRCMIISSSIANPPGPAVPEGAREILKEPPASPVVITGRIRSGRESLDLPEAFFRA